MGITVRHITSFEELEMVFKFRYNVYVREMKRNEPYANHQTGKIQEPHDYTARIIAAFDGDQIIGTLRNNCTAFSSYRESPELCSDAKLFKFESVLSMYPHGVSVSSKFMVDSSRRAGIVSLALIKDNYFHIASSGSQFDFIECKPYLVPFYQKIGYQIFDEKMIHPYYGPAICMVAAISDIAHFRAIRSPLKTLCESLNNPVVAWDPLNLAPVSSADVLEQAVDCR